MNVRMLRILAICAAYVLTYALSQIFGAIYASLFPNAVVGGFIGAPGMIERILGLPLALIFFGTFLLHVIGGKRVWWWNIVAFLPAILFEVVFDPLHIYFPALLGVLAWAAGTLINRTVRRFAPTFLA